MNHNSLPKIEVEESISDGTTTIYVLVTLFGDNIGDDTYDDYDVHSYAFTDKDTAEQVAVNLTRRGNCRVEVMTTKLSPTALIKLQS